MPNFLSRILLWRCGLRSHIGTERAAEELECFLPPNDGNSPDPRGEIRPVKITSITLGGMTCASCTLDVEEAIKAEPGVDPESVSVSLIPPRLILRHSNLVDANRLMSIISEIGYVPLSHKTSDIHPASSSERILDVNLEQYEVVFELESSSCRLRTSESKIRAMKGVVNYANLSDTRVSVTYYPALVKKQALINKLGAVKSITRIDSQRKRDDLRKNANAMARIELRNVLIGLSLLLNIFLFGMVSMILPEKSFVCRIVGYPIIEGLTLGHFIIFLSSSICQFFLGYPFYLGTIKCLFNRNIANMDVLVTLGTSVSYFYSVYQMILGILHKDTSPRSDSFEAPVFIIVFILIGRLMESITKGRAVLSIESLKELSPPIALLVEPGSADPRGTVISSDLIEVGDVLRVLAGRGFPCDGVVCTGTSLVDESMITGEPSLVRKVPGDEVVGGTLNVAACLLMKAVKVGEDTALESVIRLVELAQSLRTETQALVNTICYYFVPTVVAISVSTFCIWYYYLTFTDSGRNLLHEGQTSLELAFLFSISVLVVACPCALGLAVPTATVVGSGICAQYGILTKGGGESFETAARLSAMMFDKTGTLTYGSAVVLDYVFCEREAPKKESGRLCITPEEEVLSLVDKIEQSSSHPLGSALRKFISSKISKAKCIEGSRRFEVSNIIEVQTKGIKAKLKGKGGEHYLFCIGGDLLVEELANADKRLSPDIRAIIDEWKGDGKSVIYVTMMRVDENEEDALVLCAFSFSDAVREEGAYVVNELRKLEIKSYIITGDIHSNALSVAEKLGISSRNVFSQASSEEKSKALLTIRDVEKEHGGTVAMVGDGVNDSVALASSDLAIAIGAGSDVAIEAAQVVLMRSDLKDVLIFLNLANIIYKRIKFNFFWAFAYNVVSIPIAMGVGYVKFGLKLTPPISAAMMALSSVSVVFSSLQLYRYKYPYLRSRIQDSIV